MDLSTNGRAFIEAREARRYKPYQDERGIWTIGIGHTGPDVLPMGVMVNGRTFLAPISDRLVDDLFARDIRPLIERLNNDLEPAIAAGGVITQNMFDALVSFGFNAGISAEEHSTLMRYVLAGDYADADAQFARWVHAGDHISAGLVARRALEAKLFLTPDGA